MSQSAVATKWASVGHREAVSLLRHLRHPTWVGSFRVRLAHSWNFLSISTSQGLRGPRKQ